MQSQDERTRLSSWGRGPQATGASNVGNWRISPRRNVRDIRLPPNPVAGYPTHVWNVRTARILGALLLAACDGSIAKNAGEEKPDSLPTTTASTPADWVPAGGPGCEPQALPEQSLHLVADQVHNCAWERSRGVFCWGENASGELGDGTTQARSTPTRTQLTTEDLVQLDIGHAPTGGFSCILTTDKTVQCWGDNSVGQLGDGTNIAHATPAPVTNLSDAVELAVGTYHSCARLASARVVCWGRGEACDLGDGRCATAAGPVEALGLDNATQLAVGIHFSCALTSDGSVWCWGGNSSGEVGVGHQTAVPSPVRVPGLANVVRIAAGLSNPCAQTRDGRVLCWGSNLYGLLGVGLEDKYVTTPTEVPGLPCGAIMMPGAKCAATSGGEAYCWGVHVGDATMRRANGAARVPLDQVVALAGFRTLFALKRDGSLWAWGYNEHGQLGDGTTEDRWSPVPIALPQ